MNWQISWLVLVAVKPLELIGRAAVMVITPLQWSLQALQLLRELNCQPLGSRNASLQVRSEDPLELPLISRPVV